MRIVVKCEPDALAEMIQALGPPAKIGQHMEPIADFAVASEHNRAAIEHPEGAHPKGRVVGIFAHGVATEHNVMVLDYDSDTPDQIEAKAKAVDGLLDVQRF